MIGLAPPARITADKMEIKLKAKVKNKTIESVDRFKVVARVCFGLVETFKGFCRYRSATVIKVIPTGMSQYNIPSHFLD